MFTCLSATGIFLFVGLLRLIHRHVFSTLLHHIFDFWCIPFYKKGLKTAGRTLKFVSSVFAFMAVIRNLEGDVNRQEKPTKVAEKGKKRVLEKGKCSEKRSCVLTRLLTVRKVKPDSRFTNVNHKIIKNVFFGHFSSVFNTYLSQQVFRLVQRKD